MRLPRLFILGCALMCVALTCVASCSALIGTKEIFLGDDDGGGPLVSEEGGPGDGGGEPPTDSATPPDSGACGDTMTNALSCGACGHSCLGGLCDGGACQPFALAHDIIPRDLAIDKDHLYWTEPLSAAAYQANKDGTKLLQLGGGTSNLLLGVGTDGTSVFWGSLDGLVLRCKIGGCGNVPDETSDKADGLNALAVDGANAYWLVSSGGVGKVMKVAHDATKAAGVVLATGTVAIGDFNHVASDGAFVYWTADDGMVRRVPVGGGATAIVGRGTGSAGNLVIDNASVYWSVGVTTTGTINIAKKDGTSPDLGAVLAASQDFPLGVAVDTTDAYWVNIGNGVGETNGVVMTCKLASCTPKPLAKLQRGPTNIVVDDTAIYWTNYDLGNPQGSIMKLAK